MSDQYRIAPKSGPFSAAAVAAWHGFLGALPHRRLADGSYQMFETVTERDDFDAYVAQTGREVSEGADYVVVGPRHVTIRVSGQTLPGDALAAFLKRLGTPLRITTDLGTALTIDELCKQIGALPRQT